LGETDRHILQFFNSPNAVLATVLASTCVASFGAYVAISHAVSPRAADVPTLEATLPMDEAGPAEAAAVWVPATRETTAIDHRLGFADAAPRTLHPTLDAPDLSGWADGYSLRAPVNVIAGAPPVLPPQRPDRAVDLAAAETVEEDTVLARPAPRPATVAAQVASLRPAQRPVTLSTRSVAPEATAPEATIQQAAATAPETRPQGGITLAPARSGPNPCSRRLTREMPRRPGSAASGSAVMASLQGTSGGSRDNALIAEAMRGNMPSHMRELQPVRFTGIAAGRQTEIVICVTPDYLAVGSDRDNVRVPLGLPAALRVADAFDMMLPTPRMVDAIFQQADVRLSPQPMTPGSQMSSTNYFVRHDATLDGQMAGAGARDGLLIAGHKKDVVIANRLARAPGRVAIYGWHRPSGSAIQPLSTVHGEYYADYSHGIRLVSRTAYRDGRPVDLRALLTDGQYASLLNNDGPLSSATVRLASLQ